ncbi:unnamed protein product [Tilletia controversa]|nr:unnamed protein product [Tilletia controversa]
MFGGMSNRTEEAIYERGSAGVANWLGAWLEMAEVEYHFLTSVLDASSNQYGSSQNHHSEVSATLAAYLRNTFARALAPSLGFLNSTLSALHPHIRKNLATHMLSLLDVIGRHLSLVILVLCGRARHGWSCGWHDAAYHRWQWRWGTRECIDIEE